MVTHEDTLNTFIPKGKIQFIILGTMVAINARTIDGIKPEVPTFYYNNNRNHFWRVLQYLMNPKLKNGEHIQKFTISEKKAFLEKNGIAICNLVQGVTVANKYKHDPSDTVLFEAYKKNLIEYKKITPRFKKIMKTTPMFFTCREKKGIAQLLDGFFEHNGLSAELKDKIWYWATPTRCNPYKRSVDWRRESESFIIDDR